MCRAGKLQLGLRDLSQGAQYRPPATAEADVVDDFLILASDGLWDAVTPALACGLVRRRLVTTPRIDRPREPPLDARGSPTVLAKELAVQAVRAGSQDNVSVVLVLFRDFWARTPWHGK
jgi:protein phosphatase 2C